MGDDAHRQRDMRNTVEVSILGQRMVLRSEGDAQHVERLASFVNRKIDEIAAHGPVSSSKLAVLAALNIADDYFRALDEASLFRRLVAGKSRALLAELDGRAAGLAGPSASTGASASASVSTGGTASTPPGASASTSTGASASSEGMLSRNR